MSTCPLEIHLKYVKYRSNSVLTIVNSIQQALERLVDMASNLEGIDVKFF